MNNNHIDPRLKSLLDELQDIPARDPRRARRGRAQFLSQAVAIREEAVSPRRVLRLREWLNKFKRPKEIKMTTLLTILTITGLLIGGAGAGTVYAAQDSLPTEVLYAIKTTQEAIALRLSDGVEEELALHLEYAQHRSDEIEALLEMGVLPPEEVMLNWQNEVEAALDLASNMEKDAMASAIMQTQTMLEGTLQHIDTLELPTGVPAEVAQAREHARQQYRSVLEQTQTGLEDTQALEESLDAEIQSDLAGEPNALEAEAVQTAEDVVNDAVDTAESIIPNHEGNGHSGSSGEGNGNGNGMLPPMPPMPGFGN